MSGCRYVAACYRKLVPVAQLENLELCPFCPCRPATTTRQAERLRERLLKEHRIQQEGPSSTLPTIASLRLAKKRAWQLRPTG